MYNTEFTLSCLENVATENKFMRTAQPFG